MSNLEEVLREILAFRDERDWARLHTPRNLAAAIAAEAGELQQTILWKSDREVAEFLSTVNGASKVRAEIADVLIAALLFCHETGIEAISAIKEKLQENARKYPSGKS